MYCTYNVIIMCLVADIKKKWTNIKDSFVKDVKGNKPRKSQGPPEHRKKYYLFDHLQFLIPFIQDNANKSAADGPKSKKTRKACVQQQQAEGSTSRMSHGTTVPAPEMPADVQRHVGALNGAAGSGSAADALCQLDGDMSFMVSLLPTVKSLDEKQRINFKIGVLQLLARIKFDEVVQMQQHAPGAADATATAAAAAAYQPFVTSDLRCFPVPYQPNLPFPFVSHHHQAAVSSTQQRRHHHVNRTTAAAKQEWSPGQQAFTYSDTDDAEADDGGDGESDDNN